MKKKLLGIMTPIIAVALVFALAACEKKADNDAQIAELHARLLAAEAALEAAKGGNASAEQIQQLETAVAEIAEQETRTERRRSAPAAATGSNQMDGVLAGFERNINAFTQLTNRLAAGRISLTDAMQSPAMSDAGKIYWQLQDTPRESFTDAQYAKRLELDAKFVAAAEAFHAVSTAAPPSTAPAITGGQSGSAASTTAAPAASSQSGGFIAEGEVIPGGELVIYGAKYNDKGLTGHVTIPDGVKTIYGGTFSLNRITSVTIPNSVTTIEGFDGNQLSSITIPNSVTTIGAGAFAVNRLTSLTIPNSVTTIGRNAFASNQLTSVTIPNSVTSIGRQAFNSNQLTSVTIPNSITSIEQDTFSNNKLTSVTIPNSVTSIGNSAFFRNQLTSLTIGNRVTSIGSDAFAENQLTSVTIPASVTGIGDNAFRSNPITRVTFEGGNCNIASMSFPGNILFYFNFKNPISAGTYVWNGESWTKQGGTTAAPAAPAAQSDNTGSRRNRDQSGQQQTQQAAPPPPTPPAEDSGGRRRQR